MKPVWLAAALAFTTAAQTFTVSGTVLDGETHSPVARMRVVLSVSGQEQTAVTGADGRFSFEAPAGKWRLFVERQGWRQVYGEESSNNFGSSVITGPDQDTAHLVFVWHAPGVIFGKVIDDRGEPVDRRSCN